MVPHAHMASRLPRARLHIAAPVSNRQICLSSEGDKSMRWTNTLRSIVRALVARPHAPPHALRKRCGVRMCDPVSLLHKQVLRAR